MMAAAAEILLQSVFEIFEERKTLANLPTFNAYQYPNEIATYMSGV